MLGESFGKSIRDIITTLKSSEWSEGVPSFDGHILKQSYRSIMTFPSWYKSWWTNLYKENPVHVWIETVLILFLVYMIFFQQILSRRARASKAGGQGKGEQRALTEAEKEELILEWTPASLVPYNKEEEDEQGHVLHEQLKEQEIIIHKVLQGGKLVIEDKRPSLRSSKDTSCITDKEEKKDSSCSQPVSPSSPVKTRTVLNMCSHDFLGMSTNPALRTASKSALSVYGCGSCGPRGFYGTIDVHLDLEDEMSKFTNAEAAILYSDGASCSSSTVAAFAKRGDLLVVDEGIYEALGVGAGLSRANVHVFRHNDMKDLRRVLHRIQITDAKIGRSPNSQRRFIIVEGLYRNYGHIAPIDELVALKNEFSYRLIVDESFSFGTLGHTGRGTMEHYHKKVTRDVDICIISLENALGSIGGITVGNLEVVDHQRLSGAGYCFSASAPPFTASAAMASLACLKTNGHSLMKVLAEKRRLVYDGLRSIEGLMVMSDDESCIVLLTLDSSDSLSQDQEEWIYHQIVRNCLLEGGVIFGVSSSIRSKRGKEYTSRPPALKMTVTVAHSEQDLNMAIQTLQKAVKHVLSL